MRPLLTRITVALALVSLYAILGFTLLPALAKARLERLASETLKRQLDITEVRFNPFLLRLEIDGLDFKEADGTPILAFQQLVTDFELSSLWHRAWTFSEIRLDSPRVRLHFDRSRRTPIVGRISDLSLKLAASGEFSPSGLKLKAQDISATLGGTAVQLESSGQEIVRLEHTDLAGGQLDLEGRILQIKTAKFSQGRVDTWIDSAGELNWVQLSAAREPDTIGRGVATAQAGAQPWDIQLKHADLTGFRAGFSDRRLEKPERMLAQDLSLKLSDYSSLAKTPVGFDLKLKVREGENCLSRGKPI